MFKGGLAVGDVRKVHLKKIRARRAWTARKK